MWHCNLSVGPSLSLPMDIIGAGGVLVGSIDGAVTGGASLVPGKHGSALSLNGIDAVVAYGRHTDQCFHLPEKCTMGSTYAYWLRYRTPTSLAVILDSGGLYSPSHGFAFGIDKNGIMFLMAIDLTHEYLFEAYIGNPNHWLYIVHTWSTSSSFNLFLNGCIVGASKKDKSPRYNALAWSTDFGIGESVEMSIDRADMDLDNLLAWDEELTADEVWQLYMQAGQVDTSEWYQDTR